MFMSGRTRTKALTQDASVGTVQPASAGLPPFDMRGKKEAVCELRYQERDKHDLRDLEAGIANPLLHSRLPFRRGLLQCV
jgi:hypothetical protein